MALGTIANLISGPLIGVLIAALLKMTSNKYLIKIYFRYFGPPPDDGRLGPGSCIQFKVTCPNILFFCRVVAFGHYIGKGASILYRDGKLAQDGSSGTLIGLKMIFFGKRQKVCHMQPN